MDFLQKTSTQLFLSLVNLVSITTSLDWLQHSNDAELRQTRIVIFCCNLDDKYVKHFHNFYKLQIFQLQQIETNYSHQGLFQQFIACDNLPFFKIFSNFVHFCLIFKYFALFCPFLTLFYPFFVPFLKSCTHALTFQHRPWSYSKEKCDQVLLKAKVKVNSYLCYHMKSIVSQYKKIKQVATLCLVLKLCLCNKLIIIWGTLGNFSKKLGRMTTV